MKSNYRHHSVPSNEAPNMYLLQQEIESIKAQKELHERQNKLLLEQVLQAQQQVENMQKAYLQLKDDMSKSSTPSQNTERIPSPVPSSPPIPQSAPIPPLLHTQQDHIQSLNTAVMQMIQMHKESIASKDSTASRFPKFAGKSYQ